MKVTALLNKAYRRVLVLPDLPQFQFSYLLPGYTNQTEMRIFALRRSGHHAIINWIRFQAKGCYFFLNDCKPNSNPFISCAKKNSIIKGYFLERPYFFLEREALGKLSKKGLLVYNYEDRELEEVLTDHFEENRSKWLGESKNKIDIVILRDPFNLFASKLRWAYGKKLAPKLESFSKIVQIWKAYAREFIGKTDLLENKLTINYNKWFLDKNYREDLSDKLYLPFNDRGLYVVAKWGPTKWGDTFDGTSYDGHADQMKVLERWKNYKDDDFYRSLFKDQELLDLSEVIFGQIPDIEQLLR